jgi:hypothetical protein
MLTKESRMAPHQTKQTRVLVRARRAIENGVTAVLALLLFWLAHSGSGSFSNALYALTH